MHLKVLLVAAFVVYSTEACPCTLTNDSPIYITKPVECNSSGFNAKQSLYEKYPLLYKLYSKYCKKYCDKISGVNACPVSTVVTAPCTTTAPAPAVYAPAPCPACAAAANQQLPPEILALLGANSDVAYATPVSSCPCCSS